MDPLFWSIACVVLMLCMVTVEMLTPTMGGFTLAALIFSGLSVYMGFQNSEAAGWVMLAINVTLFPVAFYISFQFLKKSSLVHQLQSGGDVQNAPDSLPLQKLQGEIGKLITPLRPSGAALINGVKVDVMSEGKFVDAGIVVRVIRVTGSTVIVEPVS